MFCCPKLGDRKHFLVPRTLKNLSESQIKQQYQFTTEQNYVRNKSAFGSKLIAENHNNMFFYKLNTTLNFKGVIWYFGLDFPAELIMK